MLNRHATSALRVRLVAATKSYGSVVVLDDASLEVEAGEFVTLLGPSGSGKTTILNIIAGFLQPNSGRVFLGDEDVTFLPPHKRNLGIVFQNYALFPHMSVAENVAFPLRARGVPRPAVDGMVEKALDLVQLAGYGSRRVQQLSGGQRQRVALARAVVFEPRIILMDEPLSALDKQLRELMQIELRQLHRKLGATIIYVTHDQREALTMSDRIALLNGGRIVQYDQPRRIYDEPKDAFVAQFLGETTLLPAERVGDRAIRLGEFVLTTSQRVPDAGPCRLVLRTEYLSLAEPGQVANIMSGTIGELVYQGDSTLVIVDLATGARVAMRYPARAPELGRLPAAGARVTLALHPDHTLVIPA